ncbi:MAG: hypothetical protein LBF22_07115, partial [Deltaproteobacteria bacterium]|nr:hypothetical protein [Deltaproteobacteria bacterium]
MTSRDTQNTPEANPPLRVPQTKHNITSLFVSIGFSALIVLGILGISMSPFSSNATPIRQPTPRMATQNNPVVPNPNSGGNASPLAPQGQTPNSDPAADTPVSDTLSADNTSATDTSATDTSATDTSTTDTSATDTSATDTSTTDTSATDTSATDTSATDTSAPDTSTPDTSTPDTSTANTFAPEEIAPEEITTEEITTEEITTDEITTDEITTEEITTDEITTDEITTDEITTEEITTDEITTDEIIPDELASDEIILEELDDSLSKLSFGIYQAEGETPKIQFSFHFPLSAPEDNLYRNLGPNEIPLKFSEDIVSHAFFESPTVLRVILKLTPAETEKLIFEHGLELEFLGPLKNTTLINFVENNTHALPFTLKNLPSQGLAAGKRYKFILAPPTVWLTYRRQNDSGVLTLNFNREMLNFETIARARKPLSELFLSLTPNANFEGEWLSSRSLNIMSDTYTSREYLEYIMDKPLTLQFSPEFQALTGEKFTTQDLVVSAKPLRMVTPGVLILDSFALLAVEQESFNPRGKFLISLFFNRPIDREKLKYNLKLFKIPKDLEGEPIPLNFTLEESESAPPFFTATFAVEAKNGEILEFVLQDLPSADLVGNLTTKRQLVIENNFAVEFQPIYHEDNYPWKTAVQFRLNGNGFLNPNPADYISILPGNIPFVLDTSHGSRVTLWADFQRDTEYTVILKPGLATARGIIVAEESYPLTFKDSPSQRLIFTGEGRYLPANLPKLVKIAGLGYDSVGIRAWRIWENNLPFLLNITDLDTFSKFSLALSLSQTLPFRVAPTGAQKGEFFERLIDLETILGPNPKGTYLLALYPLNEKDPPQDSEKFPPLNIYQNPLSYLTVTISDLGIISQVYSGVTEVLVVSLATGKPLEGVTLRFYNSENQVLFEAITQEEGKVTASLPREELVSVTAQMGDDLSYLTYEKNPRGPRLNNAVNQRWRDLSGRFLHSNGGYAAPLPEESFPASGYHVHLFLPRDYYKPGETVESLFLLRDLNLEVPKLFPLLYEIRDPLRRVVGNGRVEFNLYGSAIISSELPVSSRTGSYSINLLIPGTSSPIGSAKFQVSDFVPPRLQITLNHDKLPLLGLAAVATLQGSVSYLFGGLGSGLPYNIATTIKQGSQNPFPDKPKFASFNFLNTVTNFSPLTVDKKSSTLDNTGEFSYTYAIGERFQGTKIPQVVELDFAVEVEELGGRTLGSQTSQLWFPYPELIGVSNFTQATAGEDIVGNLVVLTPEGLPGDTDSLFLIFSKVVTRNYKTVVRGKVVTESAQELIPEYEFSIPLSGGQGSFTIPTRETGDYILKIFAPNHPENPYERKITVYGHLLATDSESEEPPFSIVLSLDKPDYRPGEEIHLD